MRTRTTTRRALLALATAIAFLFTLASPASADGSGSGEIESGLISVGAGFFGTFEFPIPGEEENPCPDQSGEVLAFALNDTTSAANVLGLTYVSFFKSPIPFDDTWYQIKILRTGSTPGSWNPSVEPETIGAGDPVDLDLKFQISEVPGAKDDPVDCTKAEEPDCEGSISMDFTGFYDDDAGDDQDFDAGDSLQVNGAGTVNVDGCVFPWSVIDGEQATIGPNPATTNAGAVIRI